MGPIIEEKNCSSADEFLECLSPFNNYFRNVGGTKNWIFRGQSDSEWELNPAAMRDRAFIHHGIGTSAPVIPTNLDEQLHHEDEWLWNFVNECVRAGLALPDDSQWIRNVELASTAFKLSVPDLWKGVDFPFPLYRSLFGLAQHHGVPTRLLDWTQDPLVAAYFACRKVAREEFQRTKRPPPWEDSDWMPPPPVDKRLCVCALRPLAFQYTLESWHDGEFKLEPVITRVEAPYASNPNLAAQKGVFTLVRYFTPRAPDDFKLPSIEAVLRELLAKRYEGHDQDSNFPFLRKITLPYSHARSLLRLLSDANVTIATVFPSYDSVVAAIAEVGFHA